MAGKDGGEKILKQGFMVKRSQNKKRFTPVNYKQRWFVLTRQFLIYYDSDDVSTIFAMKSRTDSRLGAEKIALSALSSSATRNWNMKIRLLSKRVPVIGTRHSANAH